MSKKKRFVCVIAVLALVLCSFTPIEVSASEEEPENGGKIQLTENLAIEIAEGFAQGVDGGNNIEAVNPTKFYNLEGQAIGYIIDYLKDSSPYGYVILDSTNEDLICEYSFGNQSISPDKVAEEKNPVTTRSSVSQDENKVYRIDPFTYGVETGGTIVTNSEENYPLPQTRSIPTDDWNDIFILNYYANYEIIETNYHTTFYSLSEQMVESLTGHYACAVSAMAICADYYGLLDYPNFSEEYLKLWNYSNTTTLPTSTSEVTYGSTYSHNAISAFKKFCSEKGRYFNADTYIVDLYGGFKGCIDSGNVGLISCHIYVNGEDSGHMMAVQGYSTIKPKNASYQIRSIRVAGGWGTVARNINLSQVEWISVEGYGFHA